MILRAKDLSIDQKAAIESLLGRRVSKGEAISLRAIETQPASDERRADLLHKLNEYFEQVDAKRQPIADDYVQFLKGVCKTVLVNRYWNFPIRDASDSAILRTAVAGEPITYPLSIKTSIRPTSKPSATGSELLCWMN